MNSNFVDYVKICCRSGKGGAGSAHLLRVKYNAKAGPDGGDGGRGGHIILRGNKQMWTLLHLKYTKHVFAEDGEAGGHNLCTGREGKDQILDVPLGSVCRDFETGEQLCEIVEDGQMAVIVKGGRGGLGNDHFKSATNRTPRYAQPGEPRVERWVIIELKMLADVGLVGFPNAGKSTLLSVISAAKPEIADYPFTTLVPNLGMVRYRDDRSFVVADIPGIIEGASEGKGLGLRFLRHIERNSILLFMVSCDCEDIKKEYQVLLGELKKYNPELLDKKRILAVTKCDMMDDVMMKQLKRTLPRTLDTIMISSVAGMNIMELKDLIWKKLTESYAGDTE
ncbi:MAG: GTPase ObgE [Bacteroidales bacterium]|nr:GTPase ObgE [Bacteroidales bacterium]MBR5831397.1 GTPase ObgE [Bacteroidales bacterium]